MQRHIVWVTAATVLLLAGVAEAQGRGGTLVDRIGELRKGWSFGGGQKQAEPVDKEPLPIPQAAPNRRAGSKLAAKPKPTPAARAATTPNPRAARTAVIASDRDSSLPRVKPSELLPRRWFGDEAAVPFVTASEVEEQEGATEKLVGNQAAEAEAEQAADAGPEPTLADDSTQAKPVVRSRASAALARSIAADVVESLGPTPDEPVAAPAQKPASTPIAKQTSQPVAGSVDPTTRLTVSANPTTKTLPLTIGGDKPASESRLSGPGAHVLSGGRPGVSRSATVTDQDDALLLTQRTPVIVSRVSGPRTIVVGREANYTVLLANRGEVGAEGVETRVTIPEWAEVAGVQGADSDARVDESGSVVWRLDRLDPEKVAKLHLKLIARSGKPVELGVSWRHRPVDGTTLVEVQEPKLSIELAGPDEVLYGKPQLYRLTLSNPGTGDAEGVSLHLTPPGGVAGASTSHDFGTIVAGSDQTVEIELTAREAGRLAINARATASGDLSDEVVKEVFCRKAELSVDWRGPKERYAGAPAVYYFRVRNPGTAVADSVSLCVALPEGFEATPSDTTPMVVGGKMTYRVGALRPGDDQYFELRGVFTQAGANEMTIHAEAANQTRSETVSASTEVVALADLKLDVLDPKGPIAMGEEVTYTVRVSNRGSCEAHAVRVVGLFSVGIEPHHAEGGVSSINDGRVAFEKIDSLAAGEERVFQIHARAHEEGTHLFRAEVLCRDLEIKLAAEETTRFFRDEAIDIASESGYGYPRR